MLARDQGGEGAGRKVERLNWVRFSGSQERR